MENNVLVSVIMPVYNGQKYILQAVQSVLEQEYKNIELIVVDDGSTDSTFTLCAEIKKRDKRLNIVRKKNEGVSSARNEALRILKGKYVMFVDSDDWIAHKMITQMVSVAEENKSDVVICEYYNYVEKQKRFEKITLKEYPSKSFLDLILDDTTKYGGFAWNKLVLKEWITCTFSENIHYLENLLFLVQNAQKPTRFSIVHQPLYYYRINDESAVHCLKYSPKKVSILDALDELISLVPEKYLALYKYRYVARCYENRFYCIYYHLDMKKINIGMCVAKRYYSEIIKSIDLPNKYKFRLFLIRWFSPIYNCLKWIDQKRKHL